MQTIKENHTFRYEIEAREEITNLSGPIRPRYRVTVREYDETAEMTTPVDRTNNLVYEALYDMVLTDQALHIIRRTVPEKFEDAIIKELMNFRQDTPKPAYKTSSIETATDTLSDIIKDIE